MTPKTIATLIEQTEAQGGFVQQVDSHTWDFFIARRDTDGTIFRTRVATVGYYVRDGKNRIGQGVYAVRDWIKRVGPVC